MGGNSPERKPGCGLMTAVFRRNNPWSRKSVSAGSSPMAHNFEKPSNTQDSKRRHGGSNDFVPIKESSHNNNNNDVTNYSSRSVPNPQRPTTPHVVSQRKPQQNRDETTMGKGSSPSPTQGYIKQGLQAPHGATSLKLLEYTFYNLPMFLPRIPMCLLTTLTICARFDLVHTISYIRLVAKLALGT